MIAEVVFIQYFCAQNACCVDALLIWVYTCSSLRCTFHFQSTSAPTPIFSMTNIDTMRPQDIAEDEELERISGLLQRDNLVRGLGIVEHVYRMLHCTPGTVGSNKPQVHAFPLINLQQDMLVMINCCCSVRCYTAQCCDGSISLHITILHVNVLQRPCISLSARLISATTDCYINWEMCVLVYSLITCCVTCQSYVVGVQVLYYILVLFSHHGVDMGTPKVSRAA